jgi:predicted dinucleotide-binding enzyme
MATRETIAVIGATEKTGSAVIGKLLEIGTRLLLISDDENAFTFLTKLKSDNAEGRIEIIDCVKEGCWQADIIVFVTSFKNVTDAIERIKEVATQKIIVSITDINDNESSPFVEAQELQQFMPYSKVVAACINAYSAETYIAGDDADAVETISKLIKKAGFQPKTAQSLSAIKAL